MTRTHEKVSNSPESKRPEYTAVSAAQGIEQALGFLEGRWKLLILFHLFGGKVLRFSDLERAMPAPDSSRNRQPSVARKRGRTET